MSTKLHKSNPQFLAYLALAIVCFFWGTTYLAIKVGVQYVPGFFMAAIRNTLAGIITCCYFWFFHKASVPRGKLLRIIIIRSILLVVLGNSSVHWAEQYISSGIAAIIATTVPLWMVLETIIFFGGASVSKKSVLGLVIGYIGIVSIFYGHLEEFKEPEYIWGIAVMVAASIGWSLGSVYSSQRPINISPVYAAGLQMLFAGIISFAISFLIGEEFNLAIPMPGVLAIAYLVVFGSILTYNAYIYALSKLPVIQVSIYAYINPVVAVLLGWLILDEKLSLQIIISVVAVLLGVYFVSSDTRK